MKLLEKVFYNLTIMIVFISCLTHNKTKNPDNQEKDKNVVGIVTNDTVYDMAQNQQQILVAKNHQNILEVEKFTYDINNDGSEDTFKLYQKRLGDDPGDFQEIDVKISGVGQVKLNEPNSLWINFEKDSLLNEINLSSSNFISIVKISSNTNGIILKSYASGSLPNEYTIYKFKEDGAIEKIFQNKLSSLKIIDSNNAIEISGINPNRLVEIYTFKDSTFIFNIEKSRNQNLKLRSFLTLPIISIRHITNDELSNYDKEKLGLIKNEVFAYHGLIFSEKKWSEYFNTQKWYNAECPMDVVKMKLNSFERANIERIDSLLVSDGNTQNY